MNFSSQKQEDGTRQTFNEINITPLTDIFLVLLIIMMVIAPSFQSVNGDIKMPEINSGLSVEQKEAVVTDGPFEMCGTDCCFIDIVRGCVAVENLELRHGN